MIRVIKELSFDDDNKVLECYSVFAHLRPKLDEAEFIKRLHIQKNEGYKIAFLSDDGKIVAASGYRIAHFLAWGKVLYIDDLITHPDFKRQGCGGALLNWLLERAKEHRCDEVHLDTGHQRHDAHRLYLNKGFELSSHHMSITLENSDR